MKLLHRSKHDDLGDEIPLDSPADPGAEDLEPPSPLAGPELLMDGPLFADWFVLFQLEMEMQRAKRHERHLSILILTPIPTLGDRPSRESLELAATAAKESARITDIIGWLPDHRILVVLPETDADGAAAATHRWRTQMYSRTMRRDTLRWAVNASVDPAQYATATELVEAVSADVV